MGYLTLNDVQGQYPGLKEQIDRGKVTESRVQKWIDNAENLLNGKLGQRYSLPFTDNPPLVITLAYELFEYYWQKAIYTPTKTGEEVPWLYARYDRVLRVLDQIVSGQISLFDNSNKKVAPSPEKLKTMRSNHQEVDQIFNMKPPEEQSVDPNYDKEPTF